MKTLIPIALISSAHAFSPMKTPSLRTSTKVLSSISPQQQEKPLYDPLGLYSVDSPERTSGRLQPLETNESYGTVTDPLNLYRNKAEVDDTVQMSASLPFLKRPEMLDGSLPGDRGFDPFNFSSNKDSLQWYRNAEIKHARLAMLAAVGWPLSELFDKNAATALHMKPLLDLQDRVPSVLNGGLGKVSPVYWVSVLSIATLIEAWDLFKANEAAQNGEEYTPGDLGFDPLRLFGKTDEEKKFKLEAELFNGRLSMLAITGFAIQEWLTQNAVINETPIFFKPINAALEQLQDAAGHMMQ